MGDTGHDVFDSLFDPKKSFDSPFRVGKEGDKIVLGRYTPTLDTIALLVDTKESEPKTILNETIQTKEIFWKLVQHHEFLGHVQLTKNSTIWTILFGLNFYSYLGFLRMIKIVDAGLAKTKMERLRKDMRDLIAMNKISNDIHDMWRPLQETAANINLLLIKKLTDDSEVKHNVETLISANNSNSKIIRRLTKLSEFILEELGTKAGWHLLAYLTYQASSMDLMKLSQKQKPKDFEDLKRMKKEGFEMGYEIGKKDPLSLDPTARFAEMLLLTKKCLDEIKRALKRGISPSLLSMNIVGMCGFRPDILDDQVAFITEGLKSIAHDEKLMPSESRRSWHMEAERYFGMFKEITKENTPTVWFLNDINSGKIVTTCSKAGKKYEELKGYVHVNVLEYQFLRSMEKGEDLIECFGNRLFECMSDCKPCGLYSFLDVTKKLYGITSDFSYEELKREGLDPDRMRDAISK